MPLILPPTIFTTDRGIGQHRDQFGLHFEYAASDEDKFFFGLPWYFDAHRARFDAGDQRRVARINTELARFAGQHHELRFAGVNLLFGANDVYVQGVYGFGHDLSCL